MELIDSPSTETGPRATAQNAATHHDHSGSMSVMVRGEEAATRDTQARSLYAVKYCTHRPVSGFKMKPTMMLGSSRRDVCMGVTSWTLWKLQHRCGQRSHNWVL